MSCFGHPYALKEKQHVPPFFVLTCSEEATVIVIPHDLTKGPLAHRASSFVSFPQRCLCHLDRTNRKFV